jgi:hypothetical protein
MSTESVTSERVLSEEEIADYATTFNTMAQKAYSLPYGSPGQDVLVSAARVLFQGVASECVGKVLIEAGKLQEDKLNRPR